MRRLSIKNRKRFLVFRTRGRNDILIVSTCKGLPPPLRGPPPSEREALGLVLLINLVERATIGEMLFLRLLPAAERFVNCHERQLRELIRVFCSNLFVAPVLPSSRDT